MLCLAVLWSAPTTARAERLFWLDRPDLHAHFWLSYGVALTGTEIMEGPDPRWGPQWGTWPAVGVATVGVAALGIFKETAIDDHASWDDLLADACGILANVAVQALVDF